MQFCCFVFVVVMFCFVLFSLVFVVVVLLKWSFNQLRDWPIKHISPKFS